MKTNKFFHDISCNHGVELHSALDFPVPGPISYRMLILLGLADES
jgi:hypothetical protein